MIFHITGAEILGAIFDRKGEKRELPPDRWQPESMPSAASVVLKSYAGLGRKVLDFGRVVSEITGGMACSASPVCRRRRDC